MADLPSELRTLVDRYGAHVLDDADGLRATLNDFLDEDSSPGDVNLLVDAVRFGALARLRSLLGQGAEPAAALTDVAEGLAQRRGGDAESAYWACAVLGYAADLSSVDLIPGTGERPSSLLPPSSSDDTPQTGSADETHVVGQAGGTSLTDPNATRTSGGPAAPGPGHDQPTEEADAPVAEDGSPGATRDRRRLAAVAVVAAVLVLIIAGGVTYALTRSHSDGPTPTNDAGHDVPIETVTVDNTFGHFGTPAVMNKILESPCANVGFENADYQQYNCVFKQHPTFYIGFNNGDPATKDAKGILPSFVTNPGVNKIVTVQAPAPNASAGSTSSSLHAYVMTYQGAGTDKVRDTGDDMVSLVLYDVDTKHPGSATFTSIKPNSEPLTRDRANELLQSIGVDNGKFPLPAPFAGSKNATTGNSPLKFFAQQFLTADELAMCTEGFLVVTGEAEHVKCFASKDPKAAAYTVSFGLQRKSPGLRAAQRRYQGTQPPWSWSDKDGRRGKIIPSSSLYGTPRLFWYEDTGGEATWGLLSGKGKTSGDLRKIFEGFANRPTVNPTG